MEKLLRDAAAARSGDNGNNTENKEPAAPPAWHGAPLPRGYVDITDAVETRGCDLLNAGKGSGASVLFDRSKPSALAKSGDAAASSSAAKDYVESSADDQLLLFLPFQSNVKLHTIQLTSLPSQSSDDNDDDDDSEPPMRPANIKLFTNRPHSMDFSEADDTTPEQEIEISPAEWNADGTANLPLRFVKYQNVSSLVVYVTRGHGDGYTVRLDRVRLIGEPGEKRSGKIEKIEHDH
jgi:hypothetical protein